MRSKDIRQNSLKDLQKLLEIKRKEISDLKCQNCSGKVKNANKLKESKKDIARILTIIKEQ